MQDGYGTYISPMGCQHEGFWKEGKLSHWIKTVEVEDMAKNDIS